VAPAHQPLNPFFRDRDQRMHYLDDCPCGTDHRRQAALDGKAPQAQWPCVTYAGIADRLCAGCGWGRIYHEETLRRGRGPLAHEKADLLKQVL
jgi:hypothetical protein